MTYEQEQRLISATRADSFYQELLQKCGEMELNYLQILHSLQERDRELLESYISVCEEMEYRRTAIAYALGTQEGLRTGCAQFHTDKT